MSADGRDVTLNLTASFSCAGGRLHVTELAQPSGLHYKGLCGKGVTQWKQGELPHIQIQNK